MTLRLVEKGKGAAEGKGLGDQIWDLRNRNLRSGFFFFLTKTNRKNLFHLYLKHDIVLGGRLSTYNVNLFPLPKILLYLNISPKSAFFPPVF